MRARGVMILSSGNIVHNLRELQWNAPNLGVDCAQRFDDAVAEQLVRDPGDILKVTEHPDFAAAVPTPEHFLPILYTAGLASAEGATLEPLVRGYSMGSISMSCYGLGADVELRKDPTCAAQLPPGVPPEQTNI